MKSHDICMHTIDIIMHLCIYAMHYIIIQFLITVQQFVAVLVKMVGRAQLLTHVTVMWGGQAISVKQVCYSW